MRIVDRATFLKLEPPVIYSKLGKDQYDAVEFCIKCSNQNDNNWISLGLLPTDSLELLEAGDILEQQIQKIDAMYIDPTVTCPFDAEATRGDDCYDPVDRVRFLILESEDIKKYIALFQSALQPE